MLGLLLINLGTPKAPEAGPVREYLREFLSDERVLDINPAARAALLNLVILPRRPKQSAAAYRKIWTDRGSPLMFHSRDLTREVRSRLGVEWNVVLAMRYGEPSIASALAELSGAGADRVVVFPLYPQYASSSTGTALEAVYREAAKAWNVPQLHVVPPFYDEPEYIDAVVAVGRPVLEELEPDHVLFSYHGLPERQVKKSDATGRHCLASGDCCETIGSANRNCYRAHCFATTRALAAALELDGDRHSISFQSRLGRTPWIPPFTDHVLPELARGGVKRLAVFSPSFVADCLETLEEIQIRGEEQFRDAGGEVLKLVPAVNSSSGWVDAVVSLARRAAPAGAVAAAETEAEDPVAGAAATSS